MFWLMNLARTPAAAIPALFRPGSPPAILRLIIAVVINSVYGVFFRRRITHICIECLERVYPTRQGARVTARIAALAPSSG